MFRPLQEGKLPQSPPLSFQEVLLRLVGLHAVTGSHLKEGISLGVKGQPEHDSLLAPLCQPEKGHQCPRRRLAPWRASSSPTCSDTGSLSLGLWGKRAGGGIEVPQRTPLSPSLRLPERRQKGWNYLYFRCKIKCGII